MFNFVRDSDVSNPHLLPGIGGFQVRARGKKEEEKAKEEALLDPQVLELRRKRSNWRTKKKIKLLEKFPSYIQVRYITFVSECAFID